MNDRIYTLRVIDQSVSMTVSDFARLCGQLTGFGVDVDIIQQDTPHELTFMLRETNTEQ